MFLMCALMIRRIRWTDLQMASVKCFTLVKHQNINAYENGENLRRQLA